LLNFFNHMYLIGNNSPELRFALNWSDKLEPEQALRIVTLICDFGDRTNQNRIRARRSRRLEARDMSDSVQKRTHAFRGRQRLYAITWWAGAINVAGR